MRNSSVIFSFVVYLSIHGTHLAHPGVEIVPNTDSHCTPDTQNHTELHTRNRRHLLFEKGAALSMTVAAVKSIVSGVPRGLNIICEESIYYDLPSSASIPTLGSTPPPSTKSPSIKLEMKKKLMQKSSRYNPYQLYRYKRNVNPTDSAENTGGSPAGSVDIEGLFFQQLHKFAEIYGYNGGHCIMRTICEAQHFLYPKGQSLFHDIIRIILEFSLPTIMNNKKYFTALRTVNPLDCANLYGPHCRISFLDYFTVQIHGKFM